MEIWSITSFDLWAYMYPSIDACFYFTIESLSHDEVGDILRVLCRGGNVAGMMRV